MHELSIAMNIIEIAEDQAKRAGAVSVNEVELEIGTLSGVVIEALEFALESAAKGTILEDAKVNIHQIAGMAKCNQCGNEFGAGDYLTVCPACGNMHVEIIRGKELTVKTMKIE